MTESEKQYRPGQVVAPDVKAPADEAAAIDKLLSAHEKGGSSSSTSPSATSGADRSDEPTAEEQYYLKQYPGLSLQRLRELLENT